MSTEIVLHDVPESVRLAYRALAFRVSQGDNGAEEELARVEAQIAEHERMQRRQEAAAAEAVDREADAEQKRQERDRQAAEKHAQVALGARTAAYRRVEALTEQLAEAVVAGIEAEGQTRASCIALGIPAGRTARNLLTDHLAWKLADAGLTDFPRPVASMRVPLVD